MHQSMSGLDVCSLHLRESVRKRISKELRQQLPIRKLAGPDGLVILVALSGGKDSTLLLWALHSILKRRPDVRLIAGTIDESIDGYRQEGLDTSAELCRKYGVEHHYIGFHEIGLVGIDDIVSDIHSIRNRHPETSGLGPCSFCGVFRRRALEYLANNVGAGVIALGHNLDDTAQTVLMNLQRGDVNRLLRMAPHTSRPIEGMTPRITPMRWIPEIEVHVTVSELGLPVHLGDCPHSIGAMREQHRQAIDRLESSTPGTRNGLIRASDEIRNRLMEVMNLSEPRLLDHHCDSCQSPISLPGLCMPCKMVTWTQ